MITDYIETDILIVGSGLAGLRSAVAAVEMRNNIRVLVVTRGSGPAGSSFTNRNKALGIQVCFTDAEKEAYLEEVLSICGPGRAESELVRTMADESEDSLRFLINHGLRVRRDDNGLMQRVSGCFCPENKRAFIFERLDRLFAGFNRKILESGGKKLENQELVSLITSEDKDRVMGGLFRSEKNDRFLVVNAGATIMATGGTTSLFMWNVGGKGISGFSPALLKRAGASLVNSVYHQFVWHDSESLEPVFPYQFPEDTRILKKDGFSKNFGEIRPELIAGRLTHVPAAYENPDLAVDGLIASCSDEDGVATVRRRDGREIPIVLCAHAWNGGAEIDKNGETGVKGLYACGEAASGMHGANRLGGAMVLSTQVFGRRAGAHAVRNPGRADRIPKKDLLDHAKAITDGFTWKGEPEYERKIREELYFSSVGRLLGRKTSFAANMEKKYPAIKETRDFRTRLLFESAELIA